MAKKKSRSANFSRGERSLLIRLANTSNEVIENKKTDSVTNLAKAKCWEEIAEVFNANSDGPIREAKVLKAKYETTKKELKKIHGTTSMKRTGGGPSNPPPPPLYDEEEKRLLNNIMSSANRGDADEGGLTENAVLSDANNLTDSDSTVVEVDCCNTVPSMLQTPRIIDVHTLLSTPTLFASETVCDGEMEVLNIKDGMSRIQPTPLVTSPNTPTTKEDSNNSPTADPNRNSRRRLLIRKKRSYASTSAKFELVAQRKLEVLTLRKEILLEELEAAKINRQKEEVNKEILLEELETAKINRQIAEVTLQLKLAE